jgi:hypothetical protein
VTVFLLKREREREREEVTGSKRKLDNSIHFICNKATYRQNCRRAINVTEM